MTQQILEEVYSIHLKMIVCQISGLDDFLLGVYSFWNIYATLSVLILADQNRSK